MKLVTHVRLREAKVRVRMHLSGNTYEMNYRYRETDVRIDGPHNFHN
jgi:hypothetical protein